jgi:hypothetical protein
MDKTFKFTKQQRRELAAALAKRPSLEKKAKIESFLDDAESILSEHLNPKPAKYSTLTPKERRALFQELESRAFALLVALRELPKRERLQIDAIGKAYAEPGLSPTERSESLVCADLSLRLKPRDSNCHAGDNGMVVDLTPALTALRLNSRDSNWHWEGLESLESLCLAIANAAAFLRPAPPKKGPQKEQERSIVGALAVRHWVIVGRVSSSENGAFFAFLKELGPMVNLELGPAILKLEVASSPYLKRCRLG